MRRLHNPSRATVLACAAVLAACASAPPAPVAPPDPALAARAVDATTPRQPVQVFFDWSMTDRDASFSGRGVLRRDSGYRARVDLFGPRGETLAAAVLEGERMRVVPPNAAAMLPPPAFLWAVIGVFRAPDATLRSTAVAGDVATLAYERDGTHWTFAVGDERLVSAEWTSGDGRRTVELSGDTHFGVPDRAVFRDWAEFRELTLTVTDVEQSEGFDTDVWILPGDR